MRVLETERLTLRWPSSKDAPFMLEMLNDPAFLENIGDRGVRTEEQAEVYLQERMISSFEQHGLGMFITVHSESGAAIGLCGLVKRDELPDIDLGFAFLPAYRSQGFARESAGAVMEHARGDLGLDRLLAIVAPANRASIGLLGRLGFQFERGIKMGGDEEELELHSVALAGTG